MHRVLRRLCVTLVVALAVASVVASPSGAKDASIPVGGSLSPTSAILVPRAAGENLVFDATGTHAWAGSFTGTSTIETHFVVHNLETLTYEGVVTFTGATPCGTGTVQFNVSGSGPFPGPAEGHAVTVDRDGSTVATHAHLDTSLILTPAGAVVTYTGDVRCG
jgi:hypothetical protein